MTTQRRDCARSGARNLADQADTWWSIDQAAEHFGFKRRTILEWIRREGLKTYGRAKLLRRDDVLATFQEVRGRKRASRYSRGSMVGDEKAR